MPITLVIQVKFNVLEYTKKWCIILGYLPFVLSCNISGICPRNWIHLQGSCYLISSRALNWNAAKSACEALGSKLAMVKSQAELQAISPKLRQHVWIGLHRDPKDTSRWLWVDGTRPTYTNWNAGEPNGRNHEKCGEMYSVRYQGRWNDAPCSNGYHFVCETNSEYKPKYHGETINRYD